MDDDSPLWFKFSQCNCEDTRTTVTDLQHLIYRFRSDGIMELVNYSLITRRPAWWVGYIAAVQGLPISVATCKTYH
jgi:hypothetical protein